VATLEIRLFGTFRIDRDNQPITRLPGRRIRELLCYLILKRDIPQSREHLASLLWGNFDERNARRCLNTALWRLRGMLGDPSSAARPYLRIDAHSVCFNTDSDCWIDIVEMESECAMADQLGPDTAMQRAALYHHAASLYVGELLIDCFEDWCLVERRHMEQRYLQAVEYLAASHAERREFTTAVEYLQQIIAVDPLREDAWRTIMTLHLLAGKPAAALRVYRQFEGVLRRNLGIPPMPETQALLSRILDQQRPTGTSFEPDRMPEPSPAFAHPPEISLAVALACLSSADAAFGVARAHLSQAMTLMEGVQRRLGIAESPAPISSSTERMFSENLDQAMVLLKSTMQKL
jgi:DNA-binding SARP family transcriptional activator